MVMEPLTVPSVKTGVATPNATGMRSPLAVAHDQRITRITPDEPAPLPAHSYA